MEEKRPAYDGFDWNRGNSNKSLHKHGISARAIEEFFARDPRVIPDVRHSAVEDRFLAMGRGPALRWMLVAFTFRVHGDRRLLRPISARYMHAKEIQSHAQTDQGRP